MRIARLLVTFTMSCAAFVFAESTPACSCSLAPIPDFDAAASQFSAAAAVFEGEVLPGGLTIPGAGKPDLGVIPFRVLRRYKGELAETIEIYDSLAGTTCGFGQPIGQKFFVYGFLGKDGKIYFQACSRTSPLSAAGADLRFARGEPPLEEDKQQPGERGRLKSDPTLATNGATLRGSVHRQDGTIPEHALVTVWNLDEHGLRTNSMADLQEIGKDGIFEVHYLQPGTYKVTVEDSVLTASSRFIGDYGNISLAQGQQINSVIVELKPEPLGKVFIKVKVPPEIRDKVFVELTSTNIDMVGSPPYQFGGTAKLDARYTATFEYVPYGNYSVYVMLTGEDLSKPSWTHENVNVELHKDAAEVVVTLGPSRAN